MTATHYTRLPNRKRRSYSNQLSSIRLGWRGIVLLFALACLPAIAQSPAREYIRMNSKVIAIEIPGTASLTINNATSGSFHVGDSWTLRLQSNIRNTSFNFCSQNGCANNFGATLSDGSWTLSGSFDATSVGSWHEWVVFSGVATSNTVSFTVAN